MWKSRGARRMADNLMGIKNLSHSISLLAQQRMNSSNTLLQNIQKQLKILCPFVKKSQKNRQKKQKIKVLLVDQELFGPENKYEGSYDYVLGASWEGREKYLGPLKSSEEFLGILDREFKDQAIEFILPGSSKPEQSSEIKKYHRSFFGAEVELEKYYKKLSYLWAFYSQMFLENQYRYRLMSGAKKNAQRLAKKYSAMARDGALKTSSEQLIINSVIIGEKND